MKLWKLEYSYLVCRLIMMYCIVELQTSLLLLILSCIWPIFFLSILWMMKFFVKDFCETVQTRVFIFGMQVDNECIVLWDCQPAYPCLFFPVFIYFSFSLHFSSKISPQLYRIETSNLVYRFTTTSCIMELKMGLLLFVSSLYLFFFLSLQIFSQRYLYNRLR